MVLGARFTLISLHLIAILSLALAEECPTVEPSVEVKGLLPTQNINCSLRSDSSIVIEGDFPKTTYSTLNNVCIDDRCKNAMEGFSSVLDDTFSTALSCFKKLAKKSSTKAAVAAMNKALKSQALNENELKALLESAPARNAVQLERLRTHDGTFADFVNDAEQYIVVADTKTNEARRGSRDELKAAYGGGLNRPIRAFCFEPGTKFTAILKGGEVELAQPIDVVVRFGVGATASLPGMPVWPSIQIDPVGFKIQLTQSAQTAPSILLHEMMHILGYEHNNEDVLPMYSACQICCLPEGLRERQLDRPACEKRGKGSLYAQACAICSGKISVEKFKSIKASYEKRVRDCYVVGNPT